MSREDLVGASQPVEVAAVELFELGQVDVADRAVLDQLLAAAETVAHELHRALVHGGEVVLAFEAEDGVEVLLALDEVLQRVGVHLHMPRRAKVLLILGLHVFHGVGPRGGVPLNPGAGFVVADNVGDVGVLECLVGSAFDHCCVARSR